MSTLKGSKLCLLVIDNFFKKMEEGGEGLITKPHLKVF